GVVDAAVLTFEPDAVDVEGAELIDQIRFVGAGDDRRDLAGGELFLHAIGSDIHAASFAGRILAPMRTSPLPPAWSIVRRPGADRRRSDAIARSSPRWRSRGRRSTTPRGNSSCARASSSTTARP